MEDLTAPALGPAERGLSEGRRGGETGGSGGREAGSQAGTGSGVRVREGVCGPAVGILCLSSL